MIPPPLSQRFREMTVGCTASWIPRPLVQGQEAFPVSLFLWDTRAVKPVTVIHSRM
ncbi:hypothetical protein [Fulmarus glacialis papillomavirus 1]|uniref:Uncharacterized protein n=1 Tax=Fulmarus glacialis papillomavirus 1 TaxID=1463817 RepID=A0A059TAW1_9PAPI|nr:hypothetical protein [Fulmarus glacialis papillomavirus 1]AHV82124.1 hypothetical protein [Fulmarus glacialis papillomavirus 1]